MACRFCAIVSVKINREIAEDAHRQVPEFPAEFRRHIENQQTVDPVFVFGQRRRVRYIGRASLEVDIKELAVAGVVIERRGQLNVNVVRESKSRSRLPREHIRVRVWDKLASLTSRVSGRSPQQ